MTRQFGESWYQERLQNYFDEYFKSYEDTIEWHVNPAPNKWKFNIPELRLTIRLTCTERGLVTELRDRY